MPIRVQRKRVKGWRMPENTLYVGRPSKWGNPFKIVGDMIYGDASHRRKIFNPWIYIEPSNNNFIDWGKPLDEIVVSLYVNWLNGNDNNYIIPVPFTDVKELKDKNLACFCPLDKKCHADVLLEIANK